MNYDEVLTGLREAYDRNAPVRDHSGMPDWKARERDEFLDYLRAEGRRTLLELGSGPGRDGRFFQDHGLDVTCTDLSAEMVARCRAKGLKAIQADFLNLDLPGGSFDAVFALNSLLHVPKRDLPGVLKVVDGLLASGGLFFCGVYGGPDWEGVLADDSCEPKRFFARYGDRAILECMMGVFDLVYFRRVEVVPEADVHFQSMVLRRRS